MEKRKPSWGLEGVSSSELSRLYNIADQNGYASGHSLLEISTEYSRRLENGTQGTHVDGSLVAAEIEEARINELRSIIGGRDLSQYRGVHELPMVSLVEFNSIREMNNVRVRRIKGRRSIQK